jgi:hypothetical protein
LLGLLAAEAAPVEFVALIGLAAFALLGFAIGQFIELLGQFVDLARDLLAPVLVGLLGFALQIIEGVGGAIQITRAQGFAQLLTSAGGLTGRIRR